MLRQLTRSLRRNPVFSLTVIGCLALGLTANTSVLSILNAVVLRPLPYPQAGELLHVGLGDGTIANLPVPVSDYREWLRSNRSLAASATYRTQRATLESHGDPESIDGAVVSTRFTDVFRITPILGRFLDATDERAGTWSAVVLGHRLWTNQFGGDSSIIGRSIRLAERSVTVVGVMPPRFEFPRGAEFWMVERPLMGVEDEYYTIVVRRRSGASIDAVRADLARIPRTRTASMLPPMVDAKPTVMLLQDWLYGSAKPAVLMLFAAATLLLVIGGAGVANLVLARNASRSGEFALRFALGASRRQVAAPIIAECLLLALIAGALGLVLSVWVSRIFVHIGPPVLVQLHGVDPDWRVLLLMLASTALTGLVVGGAAAVQATRRDAADRRALRGFALRAGYRFTFVRRALVVTQMAIAMLLITGAGLLSTSLARVSSRPLGFDAGNVMIATVQLPRLRYATTASARDLFEAIRRDVAQLPGVLHATYGTPPLNGFDMMAFSPSDGSGSSYSIATDAVGPDYFATYRIPIHSGRAIDDSDNEHSEPVVVINESAKALLFPDRSPLGEYVTAMRVRGRHPRVVGVAADVPQYEPGMRVHPSAFAPLAQADIRPFELAVRTTGDATAHIAPLRRVIGEHDARLAVRFSLLDDIVRRSVSPRVFTATLASSFAILALMIATIGLLGVLSWLVAQRAHEMGIRVALGAQRSDIVVLVLREGMLLATSGLALGGMLTLAFNGLLASFVFELDPGDPAMLAAAAAIVGGVALAATLVPAFRAANADPMRAIRQD